MTNQVSNWHYLWIVPLTLVILILTILVILGVLLTITMAYTLLGALLVALPVWLIWGAIFPALMGYWEWVGIIVVIRLIFSPIFTNGINKYLTDKYQK